METLSNLPITYLSNNVGAARQPQSRTRQIKFSAYGILAATLMSLFAAKPSYACDVYVEYMQGNVYDVKDGTDDRDYIATYYLEKAPFVNVTLKDDEDGDTTIIDKKYFKAFDKNCKSGATVQMVWHPLASLKKVKQQFVSLTCDYKNRRFYTAEYPCVSATSGRTCQITARYKCIIANTIPPGQ